LTATLGVPAIHLRSLFDTLLPIHAMWAVLSHALSRGGSSGHLAVPQVPNEPGLPTQRTTRTMRDTSPRRWSVSNRISIIQQYFVTGWGGLRPQAALVPAPAPAVQTECLSPKRTEEG
jgi:hypothetical protein